MTSSGQPQHSAAANAAVKPQPSSSLNTVKQETGAAATAAAAQPASQVPPTAVTQQGTKRDPASAVGTPQAALDQGLQQTQLYGAVQQPGFTQGQGNELTQAYEPVAHPDPWNALDIMWDSDTPPGWPKLICPWQVGAF